MGAPILALLVSSLVLSGCLCEARGRKRASELATTPPRGWNSYDSFSWIISEQEFLDNARVAAEMLLPHGYEYVVVDFLWYRKKVAGVSLDSLGYDSIDEWGRMVPDPDRWPSSRGGKGFVEVAKKVHDMGLKFGIHAMRGISAQAVSANTPILDVTKGSAYKQAQRGWHAGEIGMRDRTCGWLKGFMSVNTDLGAGRAFLRSLYQQYANWGVDFVKLDCVFGDDLDAKQILTVSEILYELERPIIFSLSPGTSVTPSMAKGISEHVNMYRITGDDWDTWGDVVYHFNVARDFATANKIGAPGLHGRSWPDLDMLPLGWLTDPGVQRGPYRKCNLNLVEQRTQMTLWSMAKSPLMFGGDLRSLDRVTYSLITTPTLLEINSHSSNNMEFPHVYANEGRRNGELTQRFTSIDQAHAPDKKALRLVNCKDQKSKRWFSPSEGAIDRICWNDEMKTSDNISNCLYKKRPHMTLDINPLYKDEHQEKFHLVAAGIVDGCLDASVHRRLSASERRRISLSQCKWDTNQMWVLNDDGSLTNSYSGLCATVEPVEENANINNGVRSWIATGRKGEVYLSFFNLNPEKTQISASIGDLPKFLRRRSRHSPSCTCHEVWSGKDFGTVTQTLSTSVQGHGCALFVLNCNF